MEKNGEEERRMEKKGEEGRIMKNNDEEEYKRTMQLHSTEIH